jgi:hypothetical protein
MYILYAIIAYFAVIALAVAGWLTHVFVCIKTASWLFLIAGAICFPVGVVHGWGVWLGVL